MYMCACQTLIQALDVPSFVQSYTTSRWVLSLSPLCTGGRGGTVGGSCSLPKSSGSLLPAQVLELSQYPVGRTKCVEANPLGPPHLQCRGAEERSFIRMDCYLTFIN